MEEEEKEGRGREGGREAAAGTDADLNYVLKELKENPYRKFDSAFALMSIIPFLVFFYILVGKLFSLEILIGDVGLVLAVAILISMMGFYMGYRVVRNTLNAVLYYAARARLSDKLKSDFVATVSHEFKNPLWVIQANLKGILDKEFGEIAEMHKKLLGLCYTAAVRMGRLIEDLLDLHKIESGAYKMTKKMCNFAEMIERQIGEMEVLTIDKRLNVIREFPDEEVTSLADEDKMLEVINNLLGNAIKYTPEGGMIRMKLSVADNSIRMEFRDSGEGLSPEKVARLFNKFERFDSSKQGTGLGLVIAKQVVEMHKGKIWVESEMGKGSSFIVTIPRALE